MGGSLVVRGAVLLGAISVAVSSCVDNSITGTRDPNAAVMVLSDTATRLATSSGIASRSVTYVSLPSGTFPRARWATLTNRSSGTTVSTVVVDGGFEPVQLDGRTGDAIDVVLTDADSASNALSAVVPRRRSPSVVRTLPMRGKKDVPLNARMVIVFSEPIDSTSLDAAAIQLRRGSSVIVGRLQLQDVDHRIVMFVPSSALDANTDYQLIASPRIRDLDGDTLEAPVIVDFTTGTDSQPQGEFVFLSGQSLVITAADGSHVRVLTTLRPCWLGYVEPAWSPDASKVAFAACPPDADNPDIYVINADGSGLRRLTDDPAFDGNPAWSPDGSRLAFNSARDGDFWGVYVVGADGGSVTRLTSTPQSMIDYTGQQKYGYDWAPAWSADGTKIAFTRGVMLSDPQTADGGCNPCDDLYVMGADATNATVLRGGMSGADGSPATLPAWSPDGSMIAFTSAIDVHVINANGTAHKRLTSFRDGAGGTMWSGPNAWRGGVTWSPDASSIAFSVAPKGAGCFALFVLTLGDGQMRKLIDCAEQAAWSPRARP